MNLSKFSIKRPVTIFMMIVALLIFGFVTLPKLAVELMPEMNLPVALVVTSVDGGTTGEVEKLVTKPIEEALATVANVDTISSNSTEGASQVIVQFNWGIDMDQATLNMRDKIDQVRGALPDSAHAPRILRLDPNSQPILTLSMTGDDDVIKLKAIADKLVKPRLERIDGVASVSVSGGEDRVVEVILDPDRMSAYGLSIDQVQQALMSTNVSGAAGTVRQGDGKISLRVQGEFQDVKAIGDTEIRVGTGTILLKNIAAVNDTYKEITQKAYLDGKPSVGLNVLKSPGGNTINVADQAKKEIKALEKELPKNVKLTMIMDASVFIKDSIYSMGEHALFGGIFSILILLFFLNSARSTIIVSIVIPISIIATFSLMYFSGQTINLISLSGLTLGLGSLVDFAVVLIENIFRHREEGKGMVEAARVGSREVGTAVMASALAQICVFLPIVFVEGIAKEIFGPLALTVVFSHIAALLVSLTLVPMLSSRWLKRIPDTSLYEGKGAYKGVNPLVWFNIGFQKLTRFYARILKWSIGHRKTVFASTIVLFVLAIFCMGMVGAEFIPSMDQGKVTISIKMPSGTMLKETEKVVAEVEKTVKQIPELKQLSTSVGTSGGFLSVNSGNKAQLDLDLGPKDKRVRSTDQIMEELRTKLSVIPGADIVVKAFDQSGGTGGSALQISLRGDDLAVLEDISSIILEEVKHVEGTRNVTSSLEEKQQELQIVVDQQKAAYYGVTSTQVLSNVRTAFQGTKVTNYRTGDDEIDVQLMLPKIYKEEITYLEQLRIPTGNGSQIALSSVAKIVPADVPQMIKRVNQTREVTITGDTAGRDLQSITRDIQSKLDALTLPDGYFIEFGGQSKQMAESFGSLAIAILLSVVLVYMVMASQFESLFYPFIIMFSVPPTFIGVVLGLLLTGNSLSVPALIGYILLVGIVVNNAIVLIDYIITLRKQGIERNEAILKAGPLRLRPILMTTLATSLAIAPLAFGGGEGNESQAPMAVVVMFGLSFSTLITLILIPVVYTWFDDIGKKFKNRKLKKQAKKSKKSVPTPAEEVPTLG